MFESIRPLEKVKIRVFAVPTNHLPTFSSQLVHVIFTSSSIFPTHKEVLWPAVNEFSKVEKNSLENDKGSEPFDKPCKGLPFVAEGSQ